MFPIEQVVLLVKSTQHFWKAKVASDTDNISAGDVAEILDWFTESDGALGTCETESLLFHPLPSGRFALARIIPRRDDLLDCFRNTGSFYVHVMVVTRETLLQFANNPYAIDRALRDRHAWLPRYRRPGRLQAFSLDVGGPIFRHDLLERLVDRYGADALGALLQSVFDAVCTVFTCEGDAGELIEGLLSLLPVRWRPELSFSTEARFSLRRPVRLLGGPWTESRARFFGAETGLPRFHLRPQCPGQCRHANTPCDLFYVDESKYADDRNAPKCSRREASPDNVDGRSKNAHKAEASYMPRFSGLGATAVLDPWPHFIHNILRHKAFAFLESCLVSDLLHGGAGFSPSETDEYDFEWREPAVEEINRLGEQCLLHFSGATSMTSGFAETLPVFSDSLPEVLHSSRATSTEPHCTLSKSLILPILQNPPPGAYQSAIPGVARDETLEPELKLMTTFATRALFGDETALENFRTRWKKLSAKLSWNDRAGIRELYVGMVRSLVLRPQPLMDAKEPQRSIDALEMLDILLEEC